MHALTREGNGSSCKVSRGMQRARPARKEHPFNCSKGHQSLRKRLCAATRPCMSSICTSLAFPICDISVQMCSNFCGASAAYARHSPLNPTHGPICFPLNCRNRINSMEEPVLLLRIFDVCLQEKTVHLYRCTQAQLSTDRPDIRQSVRSSVPAS